MKLNYFLLALLVLCLAHSLVYGEEIDIQKIIMIESSGRPNAVNKSGCIGLMGINPKGALADWNSFRARKAYCIEAVQGKNGITSCLVGDTYKSYNIGDLYNPTINVKIGTWYIQKRIPQMFKTYEIEDTVENRLISYHDGISNLRKYLKEERKLGKNMKGYLRKYKEGR